jgi:hypothetical protein
VFDYIEVFFNRQRRHKTLGQLSPADLEKQHSPLDGPSLATSRLASPNKTLFAAPTANLTA